MLYRPKNQYATNPHTKMKQVSIRLTDEQVQYLDEQDESRSRAARNLIKRERADSDGPAPDDMGSEVLASAWDALSTLCPDGGHIDIGAGTSRIAESTNLPREAVKRSILPQLQARGMVRVRQQMRDVRLHVKPQGVDPEAWSP